MGFLEGYGFTPETFSLDAFLRLKPTGGFFPPVEEVRPSLERDGVVFHDDDINVTFPNGQKYWVIGRTLIPQIVGCKDPECKHQGDRE